MKIFSIDWSTFLDEASIEHWNEEGQRKNNGDSGLPVEVKLDCWVVEGGHEIQELKLVHTYWIRAVELEDAK